MDKTYRVDLDPGVGQPLREAVELAIHTGRVGLAYDMEMYVKLYLQPCPRFMPFFLYKWLMSHVVMFQSMPFLTARAAEEMQDDIAIAMTERANAITKAVHGRSAAN